MLSVRWLPRWRIWMHRLQGLKFHVGYISPRQFAGVFVLVLPTFQRNPPADYYDHKSAGKTNTIPPFCWFIMPVKEREKAINGSKCKKDKQTGN